MVIDFIYLRYLSVELTGLMEYQILSQPNLGHDHLPNPVYSKEMDPSVLKDPRLSEHSACSRRRPWEDLQSSVP